MVGAAVAGSIVLTNNGSSGNDSPAPQGEPVQLMANYVAAQGGVVNYTSMLCTAPPCSQAVQSATALLSQSDVSVQLDQAGKPEVNGSTLTVTGVSTVMGLPATATVKVTLGQAGELQNFHIEYSDMEVDSQQWRAMSGIAMIPSASPLIFSSVHDGSLRPGLNLAGSADASEQPELQVFSALPTQNELAGGRRAIKKIIGGWTVEGTLKPQFALEITHPSALTLFGKVVCILSACCDVCDCQRAVMSVTVSVL